MVRVIFFLLIFVGCGVKRDPLPYIEAYPENPPAKKTGN